MITQNKTPNDRNTKLKQPLGSLSISQKNLFFLSLLLPLFLTNCDQPKSKNHITVAISQIVEHPALDEARKGIEDVLKAQLKDIDYRIIYRNAQGNITTAKQIAQNLVDMDPDIIVGISTPSAQTLKSTLKGRKIPLVFTCVTDPVQAGLVKNLETPPIGITGVIDTPLLDQQLQMMQEIMPNLKKLGIMYNPGEPNSVATIERMKILCKKAGIGVLEGTVSKSSDISSTAHYLMPKVQAIYVPQDNILVATMRTLTKVGYALKVPVFVSDTGSLKNGALATISYSYYDVGVETGEKIIRILKGEKPEMLPITSPQKAKFYKNEKAAKKLEIKIPDTLIKHL